MNNYIDSQFVSLEHAKTLKSLGFDEPCFAFYNMKGELKRYMNEDKDWNSINDQLLNNSKITIPNTYTAPLIQQTFQWLRNNKALHCETNYNEVYHSYYGTLYDMRHGSCVSDTIAQFSGSFEIAQHQSLQFCLDYLIKL